jgi:hypothetical protein
MGCSNLVLVRFALINTHRVLPGSRNRDRTGDRARNRPIRGEDDWSFVWGFDFVALHQEMAAIHFYRARERRSVDGRRGIRSLMTL